MADKPGKSLALFDVSGVMNVAAQVHFLALLSKTEKALRQLHEKVDAMGSDEKENNLSQRDFKVRCS